MKSKKIKVSDLIPNSYIIEFSKKYNLFIYIKTIQYLNNKPSKFIISLDNLVMDKEGNLKLFPSINNRTNEFKKECYFDSIKECLKIYNKIKQQELIKSSTKN